MHEAFNANLGFCGEDLVVEGDDLLLGGNHAEDFLVFGKLELGDAFEALLQVRLHSRRVFRLGENLEEFVVGEEEETREVQSLLLQIFVQSLKTTQIND